MPRSCNRATGVIGEGIAERHLIARGYDVVGRNYRTRYGELDLIARDARCLVFCEVKTRLRPGRAGPERPLDAIGGRKRQQIRLMAGQWLQERGGLGAPTLRFDAIGITLGADGAVTKLEHVEDAFA